MKRRRWPIVIVLLVALVAAGTLRQMAAQRRGEHDLSGGGVPLSRMNSYALALLLGGLRGPLVMILWPSSEGQKSEKNLEDLDTKIEWIRLLQAEFDTVHIFQIWNKAYNISVLMANLPNKYATILDAIDYAKSVDAERPGNVNILTAIASIYFEKLGGSAEKLYYRQRVRDETQARRPMMRVTFPAALKSQFLDAVRAAGAIDRRIQLSGDPRNKTISATIPKPLAEAIQPGFNGEGITFVERQRVKRDRRDPGWRRTELDPMLASDGTILPELIEPRANAGVTPGGNDGSELQYLKKYQPYPYGISTLGLGYNYYKRTQSLLRLNDQHHAQLSDLVIDSRPALGLRDWSEEEWARGRVAELDALRLPVPDDWTSPEQRLQMEMPTAQLKLDTEFSNRAAVEEALFSYARASELADDAYAEYESHLDRMRANFDTYQSHMHGLRAQVSLTRGDHDFLALLLAKPDQRAALARSASGHYQQAIRNYQLHLLKFYVTPEQRKSYFPRDIDRSNIDDYAKENPAEIERIAERIREEVAKAGDQAEHLDDFKEYFHHIRRAQARLQTLGPLVVAGTAQR